MVSTSSAKSFWQIPQNWIILFLIIVIGIGAYKFTQHETVSDEKDAQISLDETSPDSNGSNENTSSESVVINVNNTYTKTSARPINWPTGDNKPLKESAPVAGKVTLKISPPAAAPVVANVTVLGAPQNDVAGNSSVSSQLEKNGNVLPEMVLIPKGSFSMGSSSRNYPSELPLHNVDVPEFYLGKYEITVEQYNVFASEIYAPKEALQTGNSRLPASNVSWSNAVAYTEWLSKKTDKRYRLPTEAEWEYAVKAQSKTEYYWGDQITCSLARYDGGEGSRCKSSSITTVGSYEQNRFGLFDMAGNVAEWMQDCYHDSYESAPTDGKAWLTGNCQNRVLRGGSFAHLGEGLRASARLSLPFFMGANYSGFRVVMEN